ncbi:MAG: alpha/beta fold hydrolase [Nitrospinae bacterium]|nr:alpha/beta fold hydrolase [Nitrospinota bacterium]
MTVNLEEIQTEYPFIPETLDIGGHKLSYLDEGPRDAPAILALHGNPTWSFHFRKLILALRGKYRVIAPDHMGCGLSDKPQDYPYTLETHIKNVTTLVESLGLKQITLALHDWGGAIGFGYAVNRPETIRSLILFNTAAFPSENVPARIRLCAVPWLGEFLVRKLNAFAGGAVTLGMAVNKPGLLTDAVKRGYLAPYDSWENRIAVARFVQDIPMNDTHPTYPLIKSIGEKLSLFENTPSLILWGMKDFCFSGAFLEEWLKRLKNTEAHMLMDAGHFAIEDAGERVIPMIRSFLERTGV